MVLCRIWGNFNILSLQKLEGTEADFERLTEKVTLGDRFEVSGEYLYGAKRIAEVSVIRFGFRRCLQHVSFVMIYFALGF